SRVRACRRASAGPCRPVPEMRKPRRAVSILLVGFALVFVVTAASARPSSVKEGGTLVVGALFLDHIDPALVPGPTVPDSPPGTVLLAWGVEDATCAMLLRYPATRPPAVRFDLVPEVAARYPDRSRDGKTYTFTIRKGFWFNTGAPVTAANYASAIKRALNPAMLSPARQYLQDITAVKAVGDHLVVRLSKRVPDFPARMTMPYLCPVPTNLSIEPEGVGAPLPGSGPYYVAEFVSGSRAVLRRNPYYRGTRPHHLDEIVVQIGEDQLVNTHKVEAGLVDVDI